MQNKILITSALPYANGPLHFGHIIGAYLPADCYARFQRVTGKDVLFVCGSDEYGVAITLSAELAKRTPQDHVDEFHAINSELFNKLGISFDHFSRTTWEGHHEPVLEFFKELHDNGYIEEKVTSQLYSQDDGRFLADRYVIGTCPKCQFPEARGDECPKCGGNYEATDLKNPRSKLSGAKLVLEPTKHWFLKFDEFKERLINWLDTKEWKPTVTNFVKHYIDELRPRAITRDAEWGIPVPLADAEGKVLYVWFDAPIGYISASQEWAKKQKDPDLWKKYWLDENTKYVQFIGKDNIPFHAIFFPAMVMGQNQPYKLVDELPANEFLMLEGKQFSKSSGWYIDLEAFFTKFTADQIRYALAANAPETQDAEFTWKEFQLRCNSELLGKYGNLVNRVLVFANKQCGGKVPSDETLEQVDHLFLEQVKELMQKAHDAYENFSLRKAASTIMELAACGNSYFDAKKPWKAEKGDMEATIRCCLEALRALAIISYPIIPETAQKVWSLLGYSEPLTSWEEPPLPSLLPSPEVLFKKVEDEMIQEEIDKFAKQHVSHISFDDVQKLDLRVGQILDARPIPKSKKLLKLIVDVGTEQRTIVAGIAESCDPETLHGQKVVIVANLKPAKLMGVESQGMLLAASGDHGLEPISLDKAQPGDKVS